MNESTPASPESSVAPAAFAGRIAAVLAAGALLFSGMMAAAPVGVTAQVPPTLSIGTTSTSLPIGGGTSSTSTTLPLAGMTVQKVDQSDPVEPGEQLTYRLHYANSGAATETNVVVTESYDADVTFVSSTPAPDNPGTGDDTWTIGTVGVGASGHIDVTVAVNGGLTDGELLGNTVQVQGDSGGPRFAQELTTVAEDDSDKALLRVTAFNFEPQTSGVPDAVAPGGLVRFTLSYENRGQATSYNTTLTVAQSPFTYSVSTPEPDTINILDFVYELGDLGPGANGTITGYMTASGLLEDGELTRPCVTLAGESSPPDTVDSAGLTAERCTVLPISVDVTKCQFFLRHKQSGAAVQGREVEFRLQWVDSCFTAQDTKITLEIPSSFSFVSSVGEGTASVAGTTLTLDYGTVSDNTTRRTTLTFLVDEDAPTTTILSTATLSDSENRTDSDSASVRIKSSNEFLNLSVRGSKRVRNGRNIRYGLRWRDVDADNTLTLQLPSEVTPTKVKPPASSVVGSLYTWNDVASPTGTIKIKGSVQAASPVPANFTIEAEGAIINDDDQETVEAGSTTIVSDESSGGGGGSSSGPAIRFNGARKVRAGGTMRLVTRVRRFAGTASATITLPSQVTLVETTPAATQNGQTLSWGGITAGSTATLRTEVSVPSSLASGTQLSFSVSATDGTSTESATLDVTVR